MDAKRAGGTEWECVQCSAQTKNGQQCSRWTCKYSDMCWQHTMRALGLKIAPSTIPGAGSGLFATRVFAEDSFICEYGGELVPRDEAEEEDYKSEYVLAIDDDWVIDAKSTQSGLGRWAVDCLPVNRPQDCEDNNAEFEIDVENQSAALYATEEIQPGDEIFVSYGDVYWEE